MITAFGLDFFIKDSNGGDVDTIHNVRKGIYQTEANRQAYENRGRYNSADYHSDRRYRAKNAEISEKRKKGELIDGYTGEKIPRNGKSDLDHIISAEEIHNDRGRVLAGLDGKDLANSPDNLCATNQHTNRSKKNMPMKEFLDKHGDQYTEEQKKGMLRKDEERRRAYNAEIATAYYTSGKFANDTASASLKLGAKMGLRQALGFYFAEIWFAVKDEFKRLDYDTRNDMDMGEFFRAISRGIKTGAHSASVKYKELFAQLGSGFVSGVLASLTTTLCNIFFTTARNVVQVIRQAYSSIVEATRILLFNPYNYALGDRLKAVIRILSTGAGVILGCVVSEALLSTPAGAIPAIGQIVSTFCGTLCTGIIGCTLLYFIDRSSIINTVVNRLNSIPVIETDIGFYKRQADLMERYAAELMEIDINSFRYETQIYRKIADDASSASSEDLADVLMAHLRSNGITMSWDTIHSSFDGFMKDRNVRMEFC